MSENLLIRWLAVQEAASKLQRVNPDWRRGQALFNALYDIDRPLADQIRGTMADPFYNDARIDAFATALFTPPAPSHAAEKDAAERAETYSVARIRAAFAEHAGGDEWGVPSFYEDGLIASLRGEYDGDGCRHRFPDGTRCTLAAEAHEEVPGLSEAHNFPTRVTPSAREDRAAMSIDPEPPGATLRPFTPSEAEALDLSDYAEDYIAQDHGETLDE